MDFPLDSSLHFHPEDILGSLPHAPLNKCLPYDCSNDHKIISQSIVEIINHINANINANDWTGLRVTLNCLKCVLNLKFPIQQDERQLLIQTLYLTIPHITDVTETEQILSCYFNLLGNKHGYYINRQDLILDYRIILDVFFNLFLSNCKPISSSIWSEWRDILIDLTKISRYYFDSNERENILKKCMPMFDLSSFENRINGAIRTLSLLYLFMPTTTTKNPNEDYSLWLPTMFQLWSYVNNSSALTLLSIDFFSRLARDSLTPNLNTQDTGYGIFSVLQGKKLMTRCCSLINVPILGALKQEQDNAQYQIFGQGTDKFGDTSSLSLSFAQIIVYSLRSSDLNQDKSFLKDFCQYLTSLKPIFHPSNSSGVNKILAELVRNVSKFLLIRKNLENNGRISVPLNIKLNLEVVDTIVRVLRDVGFIAIYDYNQEIRSIIGESMRYLAFLSPDLIIPGCLKRIYPSMTSVIESRRTYAAFELLKSSVQVMIKIPKFQPHVLPLLELSLPGIDQNDLEKTSVCLHFIQSVFQLTPFYDISIDLTQNLATQYIQAHLSALENSKSDDIDLPKIPIDTFDQSTNDLSLNKCYLDFELITRSSSAGLTEFAFVCLDRLFVFISNGMENADSSLNALLRATILQLLTAVPTDIRHILIEKCVRFISEAPWAALDQVEIMASVLMVERDFFISLFLQTCLQNIHDEITLYKAGGTRGTTKKNVLPKDRALIFNLRIFKIIAKSVGACPINLKKQLENTFLVMVKKLKGYAAQLASESFRRWLQGLCEIYTLDRRILDNEDISNEEILASWGKSYTIHPDAIHWHVPTRSNLKEAIELFEIWTNYTMKEAENLVLDLKNFSTSDLNGELSHDVALTIQHLAEAAFGIAHLIDFKHVKSEPDDIVKQEEFDIFIRYLSYQTDSVSINCGHHTERNLLSKEELESLTERNEKIGAALLEILDILSTKFPDQVKCIQTAVQAVSSFMQSPRLKTGHRLGDESWYHHDLEIFSIPGLRHNLPRSSMVNKVYLYQILRESLSEIRYITSLKRQIIISLLRVNKSVYSAIRAEAQNALRYIAEYYRNSSYIIIPELVKDLENSSKERLSGTLYLLKDSKLLLQIFGSIWSYRLILLNAIIEASEFDESSLKRFANSFFSSFVGIHELRRPKIIYKTPYKSTENLEELSLIEQQLKNVHSLNEKISTEFLDELPVRMKNLHWRKAVLLISFASSTVNTYTDVPHPNLLRCLAESTLGEHTAPRSLSIAIMSSMLPFIWFRARIPNTSNIGFERLCDVGTSFIDTPKEFLQDKAKYRAWLNDESRDVLINCHSSGWLVWNKTIQVTSIDVNWNLKEECKNEQLIYSFELLGTIFNKDWFLKLTKFLRQEPRNTETESNPKLRNQVISLFCYIWCLKHVSKDVIKVEDIEHTLRDLLDPSSDKYFQRFGIEILTSLFISPLHESAKERDNMTKVIMPLIKVSIDNNLTPDNINFWKSFISKIYVENDVLKYMEMTKYILSLEPELISDRAFYESALLSLKRKLIATIDSDFKFEMKYTNFLIDNIGNSYAKIRTEIGLSLNQILRAVYVPNFNDPDNLMLKCVGSQESIPIARYPTSDLLEHILSHFAQALDRHRQLRTESEEAKSVYIREAKTFLAFMQQSIAGLDYSLFYEVSSPWLIKELLFMLDINEDVEMKQLTSSMLLRVANHLHPSPVLRNFLGSLEEELEAENPWHHRTYMIPILISLLWRHQFSMTTDTRGRVYRLVRALLIDEQIEVRMMASEALTAVLTCFFKTEENEILWLVSQFEQVITTVHPKYLKSNEDLPSQIKDKSEIAERHGAMLGLSSILALISYESPPSWLPKVVVLLSECGSEPYPIGKSAKEKLDQFKRLRSDTWQMDKKIFTVNELEALSGLSSHNYFV